MYCRRGQAVGDVRGLARWHTAAARAANPRRKQRNVTWRWSISPTRAPRSGEMTRRVPVETEGRMILRHSDVHVPAYNNPDSSSPARRRS